ncbi:SAPK-interacting protein 1 [Brevipalpus obovatus]|uniref:SAPK-interacting protein 1 n=1 Tax=Brevipalpus obovatus TaxID=246614 RepID=UPI003D9F7CAC
MAFFDDRRFLLSHIRHSFITSDPTETCERVMLHQTMPHYFGSDAESTILKAVEVEAKSELLDAGHLSEINSDIEIIGAYRGRSNTAQRLERLKEEKRAAAKMKTIHWRDHSKLTTESQLEELFPRKDLEGQPNKSSQNKDQPPKRSALTFMVETFPDNPFKDFARFDARVGDRLRRTRCYEIILHILPSEQRNKSMQVVIFTQAKVRDLIGLTCWSYTNDDREPKLDSNISKYCLRIAEDNGEIDTDFPALNPNDVVEKYEFPILALVEASDDPGGFVEATPLPTFQNMNFDDLIQEKSVDARSTNSDRRFKSKSLPLKMFKKYWKSDKKNKKDDKGLS